MARTTLVVTTIQAPNAVMRSLAAGAKAAGAAFVVIGDTKSPPSYALEDVDYFPVARQHAHFGKFSEMLPTKHYSRKNLGYLEALANGSHWILETDDDNHPLPSFFTVPPASLRSRRLANCSRAWINVYRHFGPSHPVWPRGFPLESLAGDEAASDAFTRAEETPVLVQGLADANPDVDAVFRLTRAGSLPLSFAKESEPLALTRGQWCPFNSQNTWIKREIAALAYLPSHCSFRMTDIWRSFVAQRCLWERGQHVTFVASTVWQERNEHNLLRDFADEVPGYLNNAAIARALEACTLSGALEADLVACYEALVKAGFIPEAELPLVREWVAQVQQKS